MGLLIVILKESVVETTLIYSIPWRQTWQQAAAFGSDMTREIQSEDAFIKKLSIAATTTTTIRKRRPWQYWMCDTSHKAHTNHLIETMWKRGKLKPTQHHSRNKTIRKQLQNVSKWNNEIPYQPSNDCTNMSTDRLANQTDPTDRKRSRHTSKGVGGNFIFTRKIATRVVSEYLYTPPMSLKGWRHPCQPTKSYQKKKRQQVTTAFERVY